MRLNKAILILPFIFGANIYAGSNIDNELLGTFGETFCNNAKYVDCIGLSKAGCLNEYMKTAKVCIARHPLSFDKDFKLAKETKNYGDCLAKEISQVLTKHDFCSPHLETTFNKVEKDARSQLEKNKIK